MREREKVLGFDTEISMPLRSQLAAVIIGRCSSGKLHGDAPWRCPQRGDLGSIRTLKSRSKASEDKETTKVICV